MPIGEKKVYSTVKLFLGHYIALATKRHKIMNSMCLLSLFVADCLFFCASRHGRALRPADDFVGGRPQDVGRSGAHDQFFHCTDSHMRIPNYIRSKPISY